MNGEQIAKVCHEVNRVYCQVIGDDSQVPWDEAEQWQKDSAIKGVQFRRSGEGTPEDQHNAWVEDKKANGWVLGPRKDPEKKEHPCMVPYGALPLTQKAKDKLFIAVVDAMSSI